MESQNKEWIPDSQANCCSTCFRQFTWRLRRHHCRLCCQVYCNTCSHETTTRIENGANQKVRLCIKCNDINIGFNKDLEQNQPLLMNTLQEGQGDKDNNFVVTRRDTEDRHSFKLNHFGQEVNADTITSDAFFNHFDFDQPSDIKRRLSMSRPEHRKSVIEDIRSDLAQKSNQNQAVIQKYLKMTHFGSDNFEDQEDGNNYLESSNRRNTATGENKKVADIINKNFDDHVNAMIINVMAEFKINEAQWYKIFLDFTCKTVLTLKPMSAVLNDSIDINAFVKIVKIYHDDQSKCRYVSGIVFKKDIANRRMRSDIEKPRILLLANSLGYVQEDGGLALVDLEREIKQEDALIKIISNKVAQVNPDVIFVEKDVTRAVLEMLRNENRTVVTNTPPKMLLMIARCSQTIICPNSNFICKEFKIGECGHFKIEQMKGQGQVLYQQETSLLCLEGCRSELGCTIIISGNDTDELKRVRHALKRCIGLARSLYLEREYLKFIKPDLTLMNLRNGSEQMQFDDLGTSRYSINEVPETQLQAPFLFDKMIERQSLIFEHFSLAFPQKKNQDKDENTISGKDAKPAQGNATSSNIQGFKENVEDTKQVETENEIKRRLKKMCNKPSPLKIDFYCEKTDVSVFTMIKRLAKQSITTCTAEGCNKVRLTHTDYWYHGNGCVEIKFLLVDDSQKAAQGYIQKQLEQVKEVLIYAFCNKCQSMIIKKRQAPTDLLEMSFFKFLEQFFYNQNVRTMFVNAHGKQCPHLFHVDSSLLFRYGPVKIMFQYEPIQEYTLDLIHFGTTPGIFSQMEIKAKVKADLLITLENLNSALNWVEDKINVFQVWIKDAYEEMPLILGTELKPLLSNLLDFMIAYQQNFKEFHDYTAKRLFKSSNDEQMKQITDKLNRATQGSRIAHIVSERISEYVFMLRKVYQYIQDGLFNKYFTKKMTLQMYMLPSDRLEDSFVSVQPLTQSHKQDSLVSAVVGRQSAMSDVSHRSGAHNSSQVEEPTRQTFLDNEKTQNMGPSQQLRRDFRDLSEFETQLMSNQAIKQITSHCAHLPFGYNQGSVRVKPFDFTSLIAMTLNSNLYLTGLSEMDYMEMSEKTYLFNLESKNKAQIFQPQKLLTISNKDNQRGGNKSVAFNKDQEVLNQNVPFALAEAELTKPTDWEMTLEFSTTNNAFLRMQHGDDEQIVCEEEGNAQFFYDLEEPLIELGPLLETQVSHKLFEHLASVIQTTVVRSNLDKSTYPNKNLEKTQGQMEWGAYGAITADAARSEIYHLFHEQFEFTVKVYYPGHFEALRKIYCGGYADFIQSFAESHYWKDNTGGKSRSTFLMSSDKKYVVKAVKAGEVKMFQDMAGSYFDYLKESFARQCPTTIAKTLGIYKIKMRTVSRSKSETFYLLLMENLLLAADEACVKYDLKGSKRNRYIVKKSATEVTLDNNFLQDLKSRPIPLQYSMKRILNLAIHNDSLYLSKQSIIDYSMFVIINHAERTVRLGIIDYIQQYTIEKQIESYLKSNMSSEEPTIIPPEPYKIRFRTAMDKYFVAMIPDREKNVMQMVTQQFGANKIKWFTKDNVAV